MTTRGEPSPRSGERALSERVRGPVASAGRRLYRVEVLRDAATNCCTLRLAGEIDAAVVARIRELLLAGPTVGRAVVLTTDLSAARFIDVVALDLLVELRASVLAHRGAFELVGVHGQPERLIRTAQGLGITPRLHL
jgi:anti-anti-sigma factor